VTSAPHTDGSPRTAPRRRGSARCRRRNQRCRRQPERTDGTGGVELGQGQRLLPIVPGGSRRLAAHPAPSGERPDRPSGCGKSTLLRVINRMHETIPGTRAEGSVRLDGVDIYGSTVSPVRVRRTIGMVFQKPNPFSGDVDPRETSLPGCGWRGSVRDGHRRDGRECFRRAALWDEVKDKLRQPERHCPEASSSGFASLARSRPNRR